MKAYKVYYLNNKSQFRVFSFPTYEEAKVFIDENLSDESVIYLHLVVTFKNELRCPNE